MQAHLPVQDIRTKNIRKWPKSHTEYFSNGMVSSCRYLSLIKILSQVVPHELIRIQHVQLSERNYSLSTQDPFTFHEHRLQSTLSRIRKGRLRHGMMNQY